MFTKYFLTQGFGNPLANKINTPLIHGTYTSRQKYLKF